MRLDDKRMTRVVALAIALVTLAIYARVAGFDFVNYDDSDYVYANDNIKGGLSLKGIFWALTSSHATNWHPVTTLTLMLQHDLFGLNPSAFHLTNVLLHLANSILLLLVLKRLTKSLWPSALVAALFAWHPAHVESVAWVAELKDVLSTLFWLLTMWMYLRYVEAPSRKRMAAALLMFALGLMSKPMLVTLPCVLLLLDIWPLKRINLESAGEPSASAGWFGETKAWLATLKANKAQVMELVREKMPLFFLVIVSCIVTFIVQKQGGAAATLNDYPLPSRVANAVLSYARYLGVLVWPVNLCIFYPLPKTQNWLGFAAALVLIAGITAVVFRHVRRQPWLAIGWFWYLGTLVPVIGIVQVGNQAMADRYTYVPYIGLFIMLAWWLADRVREAWGRRWKGVAITAGLVCLALAARAAHQVGYWKNSQVLFEHALAVTKDNPLAHADLGVAYYQEGWEAKAFEQFQKAMEINPNYFHPPFGLGLSLIRVEKYDKAIEILSLVEKYRPKDPDVQHQLGIAYFKKGDNAQAGARFATAITLKPRHVEALNNLGMVLAAQGKLDEAVTIYLDALRADPDQPDARNNLAVAYENQGKIPEAIEQYKAAVKLASDLAEAHGNLGVLLIKQGRFDEAEPHFVRWVELKPRNPQAQFYYGLALLNAQQANLAVVHLRESVRLRPDWPFSLQTLARILATHPSPTVRNGPEAVTLAERACELTKQQDPTQLDTLAAAYAEALRFDDALKTAEQAKARAIAMGQTALADQIQQRADLYRQRKPFHQTGN